MALKCLLLFGYICCTLSDNAIVYKIASCNNEQYPIMVSNVKIQKQNLKLFISGSLETIIDIISPIKGQLNVKKYFKKLNIWLPVPCIDNMGSCSFDDLCHYGIPNNKTCPDNFITNNIPCRCPIPKGNYTMTPDNKILTITKKSILNKFYTAPSGTYYIKMSLQNSTSQITCYTFYVDYDNDLNNIDYVILSD